MQELRRVLIGCVTEEEIRAMGRLLLKRFAEEGDLASGKLLLEYACGKPTQAIELSGPNGQPLGIEVLMTAVLAALAPFPEARLAVAATLKSIPPAPDQAEHEHDDTAPQP